MPVAIASRVCCLITLLLVLACASWAQSTDASRETALLQQADQQCARGEYALAVTGYSEAIQLNRRNVLAYVSRARVYERQGQYALAIDDCTIALQCDAKNDAAYSTRGWANAVLGKYQAAIADCTAALQLDGNDGGAYATRGWTYQQLGDVTHARADAAKASALSTLADDAPPFDQASFLGPEKSCAVDFTLGFYMILVNVRIGSEKTDYCFVVDTGADTNVISTELAAKLKVKTLREQTSIDAAGASGKVLFNSVESLTLGTCQVLHALTVATDLQELSSAAGRKIDGIIGDNFLRHYRLTIDYARHRLTLAQTAEPLSGSYLIKAVAAQPLTAISVPITVDGQPLTARVDTGAYDIALPGTFLQTLNYPSTEKLSSSGALAGGLWGASPYSETLVRVKDLQLGEFHLRHYPMASLFCDFGVLGEEFLTQFLVTIDYPTRTVAFTPVINPVFKTNLFAAGLGGLPMRQNGLRISGIWENSPAAKAAIHPGDLIRAINGITDEDAIVETLRTFRTNDAIPSVELLLESGGVQRRVTLKKDWLFPPVQ